MESQIEACWSYLKLNGQKVPALGLVVQGTLGTLPRKGEMLTRIDTGYDGFLLLSEDNYKHVGLYLSELPRKYWPEGETVTGEVFKLRRALALVYVPKAGLKLEGYIDTFQGNTENLAGLNFIKTMKLLLTGQVRKLALPKQLSRLPS
ncbi:MAG: hypothetical protein QW231_00940 [Candidatus Bathyarchaeia archaeon]